MNKYFRLINAKTKELVYAADSATECTLEGIRMIKGRGEFVIIYYSPLPNMPPQVCSEFIMYLPGDKDVTDGS